MAPKATASTNSATPALPFGSVASERFGRRSVPSSGRHSTNPVRQPIRLRVKRPGRPVSFALRIFGQMPSTAILLPSKMERVGGERAGNRTPNLVVKSHLLCQLSYAPRRKLEAPGFEIKAGFNLIAKLDPAIRSPLRPAFRSRVRHRCRGRPRLSREGLRFEPDLVTVGFYWNDLIGNEPALPDIASTPKLLPDARLKILPATRHLMPIENAHAVNRALRSFLGEGGRGPDFAPRSAKG